MESASPQRNLEPLLQDEISATPRMGAYAPPAAQEPLATETTGMPPTSESYDLHLVTTNAAGEVLNAPTETRAALAGDSSRDEVSMPPLVSYCSYVRYALAFGKWLILFTTINAIAIGICRRSGYFDWDRTFPFDSWRGGLLASTWLLSSTFFYGAAKTVDRDVQHADHMAQYQQGNQSEDQISARRFVPNYQHVYGQVSRRLDSFLHSTSSPENASSRNPAPLPEGPSSLTNISYALWAVLLAGAAFMGTGSLLGKSYIGACDPSNLPANTNSTKKNGNDFQDVAQFPSDVQEWITDQRDPWGSGRIVGFDDDYSYDGQEGLPDAFSFPVVYERDPGVVAAMTDGTLFSAVRPPPTKSTNGDTYISSNHLVLVETSPTGKSPTYHDEILNPRMFIPIENTIDDDENGMQRATKYCFTASKDPTERKKKKQRRSWDAIIRTSDIHCIATKTSGDGSKFDFQKTTIAWTDKSHRGPELVAASSGGQILISHVGEDDYHVFQEVVSINPNSMEQTIVFHRTRSEEQFYGWDSAGHPFTRCVQDHVFVYSIIAGLVGLLLTGIWLIIREGVAAGVAPIILSAVATIRSLTGEYAFGVTSLSLTVGTIFFHVVLCCGPSSMCHLPSWIGRDMYIWALYSWILSFVFVDWVFGMGDITVLALFFLAFSGIVLEHPVAHLMGYASLTIGLTVAVLWPFFGDPDGLFVAAMAIVVGFGMIGASDFISKKRKFCLVFCRPFTQAGRVMFYGTQRPSSGPSVPDFSSPTHATGVV